MQFWTQICGSFFQVTSRKHQTEDLGLDMDLFLKGSDWDLTRGVGKKT